MVQRQLHRKPLPRSICTAHSSAPCTIGVYSIYFNNTIDYNITYYFYCFFVTRIF